MTYDEIVQTLNNDPVAQELIQAPVLARLAYTARDGNPRVIPVSYLWNGAAFVFGTLPDSAKVAALRANPHVALTIDTNNFPPNVLLVRGKVTNMDERQGVPVEYVEAARRVVGAARMPGWEEGVHAQHKAITLISITPTWIKVTDFVRTFPGPSPKE